MDYWGGGGGGGGKGYVGPPLIYMLIIGNIEFIYCNTLNVCGNKISRFNENNILVEINLGGREYHTLTKYIEGYVPTYGGNMGPHVQGLIGSSMVPSDIVSPMTWTIQNY